jgi:hypothetical protein
VEQNRKRALARGLAGAGELVADRVGQSRLRHSIREGENRRTVMCFDRADRQAALAIRRDLHRARITQQNNPFCAATPVTDGERVIASFGSAGLYCYDFDGKELWHRDLGKINHMFGNASSPVIHGDRCFLHVGPDENPGSWR